MSFRTYAGSFPDEAGFMAAARGCADAGVVAVDAVTPYPVHGLDPLLGLAPSRLPYVTLVAGVLGGSGGLWLQYWVSRTDWPLDVGGRPWNSWPAFVPVAFELTILCAGLATVAALVVRARLGRRPDPSRLPAGGGDDRFTLYVRRSATAARGEAPDGFLRRHGAATVTESAS